MAIRDKDVRLAPTETKCRPSALDRPERSGDRSRADVVMVTGDGLYGLEIKSDADAYERLSRQVKDYNKYFDYRHLSGRGGSYSFFKGAFRIQP